MNSPQSMTMRDVFLGRLYAALKEGEKVFIVTDDFGAPTLDKIRSEFKDRFVNVGIAEQNAVNVATGLALEGFTAYAYGIAGFMTMRCYEQIRTNLSMAAQLRPLNVNIVGVGAGFSYDVSGPSHHCLEDITLMRLLPNMEVLSPGDWVTASRFAERSLHVNKPKYIRLDSKPVPQIYAEDAAVSLEDGFHELAQGGGTCVVATGFMTQVARRALAQATVPIGLVDLFSFKPLDEERLFGVLKQYRQIVTVEEGFIHRGGLDALIVGLLAQRGAAIPVRALGVDDRFIYDVGNRSLLHKLAGMDEESILQAVAKANAA
ncbi:MAG: transketolase [Verrucomicrobia bacterium]|nr:transketolase [Verrucomicrobiota bacterium]